MKLFSFKKNSDLGILVMRTVIGTSFVFLHGFSKISGGLESWRKIGMATANVGIHFSPAFWGFMAACSEFFGGICLILGLFFRPAAFLILCVMTVAASMHLKMGQGLMAASHPIELGFLMIGFILAGPGKYSLDRK